MKLYVLLLPEGIEPPEDGDFVTLWHGNGWGEDVEIREATGQEIYDALTLNALTFRLNATEGK